MVDLFIEIVPEFETWFQAFVVDMFGYFAAGILVAFILWTIGYVVDAAFGYLNTMGR